MRRVLALVHAAADIDWAYRAAMRLGREHNICRIVLHPQEFSAAMRSLGGVELFVVVLSRGLLHDRGANALIQRLQWHANAQWLVAVKDRGLEREIPSCLAHVHALVPQGDLVAALAAKLARPTLRSRAQRYSAAMVVAMVALVGMGMFAGLGLATGLLPAGLERLAAWSAVGFEPLALERPAIGREREATADPSGGTAGAEPRPVTELAAPPRPEASSPVVDAAIERRARAIFEPPHLETQRFRIRGAQPLVLVYLRGGPFTMGNPYSSQDPGLREASVSGFWVSDVEVTQAQWSAVMGYQPSASMAELGDGYPVQSITWREAVDFLNRLSILLDLVPCYERESARAWRWRPHCDGLRLPTEVEWEYAARAGGTTSFSFGESARSICDHGNVADLSGKKLHVSWPSRLRCDDGFSELAPVRSFAPSQWKLHDMHGNVREFVWDRFATLPSVVPLDYRGPEQGEHVIARGGAYSLSPGWARAGVRWHASTGYRERNLGLRIARSGPRTGSGLERDR